MSVTNAHKRFFRKGIMNKLKIRIETCHKHTYTQRHTYIYIYIYICLKWFVKQHQVNKTKCKELNTLLNVIVVLQIILDVYNLFYPAIRLLFVIINGVK